MKFMRKLIIGSILGTDMLKHFNILHKMQQRFTNLEEIPMGNGENDIENAAKLLLHTADLSHPIKAYEVFSLWSTRVCEEFTR